MKKILIIEDDQALYNVYATELKANGYDVSNISTGGEAVEGIRNIKPDLVLLDIMLPSKNGLEILQEMKEDEELSATKVVMLTNYGSDENVKKAIELGAEGYLLKYNIVPSELNQKIGGYLGDGGDSPVPLTDTA